MRASSLRRSTRLISSVICFGRGGGFRSRRVKISRVCATVRAGFFFPQPPPLQDQEPQRQQGERHVVVPALPTADLVMVQANLPLALLQQLSTLCRCPWAYTTSARGT